MSALKKFPFKCIFFETKKGCKKATNCPYQHDPSAPSPKLKKPCRWFKTLKGCQFGDTCYFQHEAKGETAATSYDCPYGVSCIFRAHNCCKNSHPVSQAESSEDQEAIPERGAKKKKPKQLRLEDLLPEYLLKGIKDEKQYEKQIKRFINGPRQEWKELAKCVFKQTAEQRCVGAIGGHVGVLRGWGFDWRVPANVKLGVEEALALSLMTIGVLIADYPGAKTLLLKMLNR